MATGREKKRAKTGSSSVPRPKPEKKVRPAVRKAARAGRKYTMMVIAFTSKERSTYALYGRSPLFILFDWLMLKDNGVFSLAEVWTRRRIG